MKRKRKILIICAGVLGAFIVFMCVGAMAADPTVEISATIVSTLNFSLNSTAFTWGAIEPGVDKTDTTTATISSNKGWSVSVTKDQDLTSPSGVIDPSAFTFTSAPDGGGKITTYQSTDTAFGTDTQVYVGTRAGGIEGVITYKLVVSWDIAADVYTATHTYTAIQQ